MPAVRDKGIIRLSTEKIMAAFDLGGTKIDAVLFTEDGTVLRHTVAPGGSPLDIGPERSVENVVAVMERLTEGGGVDTLYCGYAGVDHTHGLAARMMRERLPGIRRMRVEGDCRCMISATFGPEGDACCVICGTGSSIGVRKDGRVFHIGGWGYLLDSGGSGYVLARRAIRRALMDLDGRRPHTLLTDILHRMCGEPVKDHIARFYEGGRRYIASMAPAVFEARAAGDPAACEIFDGGARELSELTFAALKALGGPYSAVFDGGVFAHHPEYMRAVMSLCPPGVTCTAADAPPVYGSAVEAMYDMGLRADAAFKERFMKGYRDEDRLS